MSLKHATLGLLAQGPASGYDLLGLFDESLANVWPATQSQLYGELNKLARDGLVEVGAEGARGRKEYAITDSGRAELRHWLVDVPPTGTRRNDVLLRVFFLGLVEPGERIAFLAERFASAKAHEERYADIERELEGNGNDLALYGRIALEWGRRFNAMQREWVEWAIAEVERGPGAADGPAEDRAELGFPARAE